PAPAVSFQEAAVGLAPDPHPRPAAQKARVAVRRVEQPSKLILDPPREIVKSPPARKKRKNSLAIHFIGEEEHTCPYCLDKVEKDDPRGVKICPICKTWHHADCWGITGACQIPHMHES
ncbi:MAG: RING finger protein, partial [Anaerolineales bacterium]